MTATQFSWWYNRKRIFKKQRLKISDEEISKKFKEVFGK